MSPKRTGTAAVWGFYGVEVLVVPPPAPPTERSEEYLSCESNTDVNVAQEV